MYYQYSACKINAHHFLIILIRSSLIEKTNSHSANSRDSYITSVDTFHGFQVFILFIPVLLYQWSSHTLLLIIKCGQLTLFHETSLTGLLADNNFKIQEYTCKPTVTHADFCIRKHRKKEWMVLFMVASHHRSLPMLTVHFYHKKNLLHNVKSTRWIITNKIIYGSSNAERKGDNSSVSILPIYICVSSDTKNMYSLVVMRHNSLSHSR